MKGKYFDIHKVTSHPYCCSLGLHADFKNRYVAFHFLWFYIHIGKTRQATFKSMKDQKAFYKLQAKHTKAETKALKKYGVECYIT